MIDDGFNIIHHPLNPKQLQDMLEQMRDANRSDPFAAQKMLRDYKNKQWPITIYEPKRPPRFVTYRFKQVGNETVMTARP